MKIQETKPVGMEEVRKKVKKKDEVQSKRKKKTWARSPSVSFLGVDRTTRNATC